MIRIAGYPDRPAVTDRDAQGTGIWTVVRAGALHHDRIRAIAWSGADVRIHCVGMRGIHGEPMLS